MNRGVSLVLRTEASKLTTSKLGRPVAVTHVTQSTCPSGCPWFDSGCYAQLGPEGRVTRRLAVSEGERGSASADSRALSASLEEARQIWAAAARSIEEPGNIRGVPLRLRVVGDVAGALGALVTGRAAGAWVARGGGAPWAYTHRAFEIDRRVWGPVSVMASCETDAQVAEATRRGYVPALVRDFDAPRPEGGIPCPQQTGKRADCASCMACSRDDRLRAGGRYIVLNPHGPGHRPTRAMQAKLAAFAN